jgi:hypothetical protein
MAGWSVVELMITLVIEVETITSPRFLSMISMAGDEAAAQTRGSPRASSTSAAICCSESSVCHRLDGTRIASTRVGNDKVRANLAGPAVALPRRPDRLFFRRSRSTAICTHLHVDHVDGTHLVGRWVPTFPALRVRRRSRLLAARPIRTTIPVGGALAADLEVGSPTSPVDHEV